MTFSNGPMFSSQSGWTQPPRRKSLVGSSSGPPGACMTPSSEMKTAPVNLRIGCLALQSGFNPRDVDFFHRHHGIECALGRGLVGTGGRLQQHARRDLPGEAPFVLAPAASAFLPAIAGDCVPVAIGLFLVLGQDHEAHGLIGLEVRPAVEADEVAAEKSKLDGELCSLCSAREVAGCGIHLADVA